MYIIYDSITLSDGTRARINYKLELQHPEYKSFKLVEVKPNIYSIN